MKVLGTILAIILWANCVSAQTCDTIANQFFKGVQEDKVQAAMDQAWATNPYAPGMKDTLSQITSQLLATLSSVGKYRNNQLVVKKEWSGRYAYLYYFVAFDRQPLKFEFQCYRPNDKWVLQNFRFSDKVTDDFTASAAGDLFKDRE